MALGSLIACTSLAICKTDCKKKKRRRRSNGARITQPVTSRNANHVVVQPVQQSSGRGHHRHPTVDADEPEHFNNNSFLSSPSTPKSLTTPTRPRRLDFGFAGPASRRPLENMMPTDNRQMPVSNRISPPEHRQRPVNNVVQPVDNTTDHQQRPVDNVMSNPRPRNISMVVSSEHQQRPASMEVHTDQRQRPASLVLPPGHQLPVNKSIPTSYQWQQDNMMPTAR